MATIIIKNIPKAYAEYLARHLPREHRKTRGKIEIRK